MAKKVNIELEANTSKATSEVEKLIDAINDMNKNISEFGKDGKKALDGVEKEGKKATKSLGALEKITKGLFVIEALEAAFGFFKETLGQNQQVVNLFNTTFETLSLAFNDLFSFLNDNVGTVVGYFKNIFSDPKQALVDFGTAIKNNIVERFNSLLDTLGFLATAFKKVFEGDFAGALDSVKSAGKEAVDVLTGVPDTFDKVVEVAPKVVKGITDYTKSTVQAAKETVELNRAAEVGIAQNQIILEQKDREAEKLRQIRDDETKTIAERIKANEDLGAVLDEQERLMLANADAVIAAAQAQFDKNANDENQIALLEARAEREGILAQIEGFRSEQLINRVSLDREAEDLKKEKDEAEKERLEELIELEQERKEQMLDNLETVKSTFGEETAIGKAAFLAKQGLLIKEQIAEARATLQRITLRSAEATVDTAKGAASTAKVGFPQNVPLLIAFAAQAAGIIAAVSTAVSATKSAAGGMGGGSVSAPTQPTAPAFNIVGAAPENQLAQTIGEQEQQPIKAFVVSSDVSSAQALDRNIIENASI